MAWGAIIGIGASVISNALLDKDKTKESHTNAMRAMRGSMMSPAGYVGQEALFKSREALARPILDASSFYDADTLRTGGRELQTGAMQNWASAQRRQARQADTAMRLTDARTQHLPLSARMRAMGGMQEGIGEAAQGMQRAGQEGVMGATGQKLAFTQAAAGVEGAGREQYWNQNVAPYLVRSDPGGYGIGSNILSGPKYAGLQTALGYIARTGLSHTAGKLGSGQAGYDTGPEGTIQSPTLGDDGGAGMQPGLVNNQAGPVSPFFGNLFEKRGQPQTWTSDLFTNRTQQRGYGIGNLFS